MSEREKLFRSNAKITDRLIDLRDQLIETRNLKIQQDIRDRINCLEDILSYNREKIDMIDGVLDT